MKILVPADKRTFFAVIVIMLAVVTSYELGHYRGQRGADRWYATHWTGCFKWSEDFPQGIK